MLNRLSQNLMASVTAGRCDEIKDLLGQLSRQGKSVNDVRVQHWGTLLHYAIEFGNEDVIDLLISNGADINAKDAEHRATPLHHAALRGDSAIVELLLINGAFANIKDCNNKMPLHVALAGKSEMSVDLLLQFGALADVKFKGYSALYFAVGEQLTGMVRVLLSHNVNVNDRDAAGSTVLHLAAGKESKDIVKLLLIAKANVEAKDSSGLTPLHYALSKQLVSEDIVGLLLEFGADANEATSNEGLTPIHIAVHNKVNLGVVKLLLAHGADVKLRDNNGESLLHKVILGGDDFELVKLILAHGADVNALNGNKLSVLHCAAAQSSVEIVKLLLNKGANVGAEGPHEITPLYSALIRGEMFGREIDLEIVALLLRNGADVYKCWETVLRLAEQGNRRILQLLLDHGVVDVNYQSESDGNKTLLQMACKCGHSELVKFLWLRGAKVNVSNNKGLTGLLYAIASGQSEIVKLLLDCGSFVNDELKTGFVPLLCSLATPAGRSKEIVQHLVDYGAVVNAEFLNTNLVAIALVENLREIAEIFVKELAIVKFSNAQVNEKILLTINSVPDLLCFMEDCEQEIERLKVARFNGVLVPIFDFLRIKNIRHLASFVADKNTFEQVKSKNFSFMYPIYGFDICQRFEQSEARYKLIKPVERFFYSLLDKQGNKLPRLPIDSVGKIFMYFDEKDLQNLNDALWMV